MLRLSMNQIMYLFIIFNQTRGEIFINFEILFRRKRNRTNNNKINSGIFVARTPTIRQMLRLSMDQIVYLYFITHYSYDSLLSHERWDESARVRITVISRNRKSRVKRSDLVNEQFIDSRDPCHEQNLFWIEIEALQENWKRETVVFPLV